MSVTPASLKTLVHENNFDGVTACVQQLKKEQGLPWYIKGPPQEVLDACRDAILLGRRNIVQVFFNEGVYPTGYARVSDNDPALRPFKYFAAKVDLLMYQLLDHNVAEAEGDRGDSCGDTYALEAAIKSGRTDVVHYMLEHGRNPNGKFKGRGRTHKLFLAWAALNGQKDMVRLLIRHGASVTRALRENYDDFYTTYCPSGRTADEVSQEASLECPDWVRILLRKHQLIPFVQGGPGAQKALLELYCHDLNHPCRHRERTADEVQKAFLQYSNSVQILLDNAMGLNLHQFEAGPRYKRTYHDALTFLRGLDVSGFNFVGVAIYDRPITRKDLLDRQLDGADKALVTYEDIGRVQDGERRQELIANLEAMMQSRGKIVSPEGHINLVSLEDAVKSGQADIVRARLSAGANPNERTNGSPCIVVAAKMGFLEVVQLLVTHPLIHPAARMDAAETAGMAGHGEIVQYLNSLDNVNQWDSQRNARIHNAVKAQDVEGIINLIAQGADLNLRNGDHETPLYLAATLFNRSEKTNQILEALLKNGADPNISCYREEETPLYGAVRAGNAKAVAILLPVTKKREVNELDGWTKPGRIPWYAPLVKAAYYSIYYSRNEGGIAIARLLKDQGADCNAIMSFSDVLPWRESEFIMAFS